MRCLSTIILAAGASRRMPNAHKLLLPLGGATVLRQTLWQYIAAGGYYNGTITLVLGHRAEEVLQSVAALRPFFRAVVNVAWEEGMGASIRAGVAASSPASDGYLIALGDLPLVQPNTIQKLIQQFYLQKAQTPILQPVFAGKRGHPVLFDGRYRAALETCKGDEGARQVLQGYAKNRFEYPSQDEGILLDVDTPAAYQMVLQRFRPA